MFCVVLPAVAESVTDLTNESNFAPRTYVTRTHSNSLWMTVALLSLVIAPPPYPDFVARFLTHREGPRPHYIRAYSKRRVGWSICKIHSRDPCVDKSYRGKLLRKDVRPRFIVQQPHVPIYQIRDIRCRMNAAWKTLQRFSRNVHFHTRQVRVRVKCNDVDLQKIDSSPESYKGITFNAGENVQQLPSCD